MPPALCHTCREPIPPGPSVSSPGLVGAAEPTPTMTGISSSNVTLVDPSNGGTPTTRPKRRVNASGFGADIPNEEMARLRTDRRIYRGIRSALDENGKPDWRAHFAYRLRVGRGLTARCHRSSHRRGSMISASNSRTASSLAAHPFTRCGVSLGPMPRDNESLLLADGGIAEMGCPVVLKI
jgi:hypothetical protein